MRAYEPPYELQKIDKQSYLRLNKFLLLIHRTARISTDAIRYGIFTILNAQSVKRTTAFRLRVNLR